MLEGNPGGRPLNHEEPKPTIGAPEMPRGMSHVARREWRLMSAHLLKLGVLSVIDGKALAMYCAAYSDWEEADKECKKKGSWIEVMGAFGNVWKLAPWFNARCTCAKMMKSFLIEFGMTPASRTRLKIEKKSEAQDDALLSRDAAQPSVQDDIDLSSIDETQIQ